MDEHPLVGRKVAPYNIRRSMETLKRFGNGLGWFVVIVIGIALVFGTIWLSFGTAGASPATSEIANLRYGPATCDSNEVFVSGTYGGTSPGVVALQRKGTDGVFRTIGDDGTEARINGQSFIGRGWVAVEYGDIFQVTHSVPVEDIARYRIVTASSTQQLMGEERPVKVLGTFDSYRPSPGFCQEAKIAK